MTESQVEQQSTETTTTTVEIVTNEVETKETTVATVQKTVEEHEESTYHLTKDDIDDYEESQAKFRELWEKKREKVRKRWI